MMSTFGNHHMSYDLTAGYWSSQFMSIAGGGRCLPKAADVSWTLGESNGSAIGHMKSTKITVLDVVSLSCS